MKTEEQNLDTLSSTVRQVGLRAHRALRRAEAPEDEGADPAGEARHVLGEIDRALAEVEQRRADSLRQWLLALRARVEPLAPRPETGPMTGPGPGPGPGDGAEPDRPTLLSMTPDRFGVT